MAHHKNKLPECANCGFKFESADNYCPSCGQENHDIRLPLMHHIYEVFEGLLHLDSKSFRSAKKLILHPGSMSKEFNSGKRVQFVAPLRFYIFVSFFFFLILSIKPFYTEEENKKDVGLSMKFLTEGDAIKDYERNRFSKEELDSITKFRTELSINELRGLSDKQIDSLVKAKGMDINWVNKYVVTKFSKIARGEEEKFWHSILKNISYSMFILMPVFALVLMLFYKRNMKYYVESLVLSIHYHIDIFLVFGILIFIGKFGPFSGWLILLGILYIPIYLYFMLRNYFNQGVFVTITKVILIKVIHFILIALSFMGSVLVSMALV